MGSKLQFNPGFCVGCFACEIACKQEHLLEPGVRWIKMEREEAVTENHKPHLSFKLRVCEHCDDPPCAAVCPSEAIGKRSDGIVLIDYDRCIGCEECVEACPFGAMAYNPDQEMASKCDLCLHRLEQNIEPSCVAYCQGHAISLITNGIGG